MYGMTLKEHSRKQIQMHMAAKAIADRLAKKTNKFSAKSSWFTFNEALFSKLNGGAVTVEPFVDGEFVKYINNDGTIGIPRP